MDEAMLAIFAGDASAAHTGFQILLFKACYYMYYMACLFRLRNKWNAYRRRSRSLSGPVADATGYAVNQSS
jgi:hypothetical protein